MEDRLELITLLPNNKFNPDFDVSFDVDSPNLPKVNELEEVTVKLGIQWLSEARLHLALQKAVEDEGVLKDMCDICKMDEHLKAITLVSFEELLGEYKEAFKGLPIKINHWKKFYHRNQKIRTLCVDCAYLEQLKKKKDPRAFSSLTRIAHEEFMLFKTEKKKIRNRTREIALIWLKKARENIKEESHDYGELYTIESVDEEDISAFVSDLEEPE